jgi:hypothetical protein
MNFIKGEKYNIVKDLIDDGIYTYYGMTNSFVDKDFGIITCPDIYVKEVIENLPATGDCYIFALPDPDNPDELISYSVNTILDPDNPGNIIPHPRYVITKAIDYGFPQITHENFLCKWETHSKLFRNAFIQVFIDESKEYNNLNQTNRDINRDIKSGALTRMIYKDTNPQPAGTRSLPKIDKNIDKKLIYEWYRSAIFSTPQLVIKNEDWCFYRSNNYEEISNYNSFIQPLPTSYTTSLKFALNWDPLVTCCIIKLLVPMGTPITFLDHSGYTDTSKHDISDTQAEVVVPAGDIVIDNKYMLNNKIVVIARLYPWTVDQCLFYIENNLI